MKKRVFSLLLALTLLLCALPLPVHAAANEITVYNWGQYISDGTDESLDVIQAFEEETGIKVNYLTFDSNESMYTKLKTGGTTFDVIIPSDYMIAKLISEDMLEPLDFANIPNYEYIDEAFRDQAYDPQNAYSVPYTWGTVGLIYNKNYVSEEDAQSWSCLWNSKYQGKHGARRSLGGPLLRGRLSDHGRGKPRSRLQPPERGLQYLHRRHVHPEGLPEQGGCRGLHQLPVPPGHFGCEPRLHRLLHTGDRREGVSGRRSHLQPCLLPG